jgi:hypothetical protein
MGTPHAVRCTACAHVLLCVSLSLDRDVWTMGAGITSADLIFGSFTEMHVEEKGCMTPIIGLYSSLHR